ncbi:MAG: hypothetical protein K1V72_10415 [Duncaniella sp.]|jgi:hypothetical protein
MRAFIIFLLLVLSVNCSACDKTSNDSLYNNIGYVDGTCVKDYKVVYLSLGRNPWESDTNNEKIFNQIFPREKDIPSTCMEFSYKGEKYYIPVDKDCNLPILIGGEEIMISVVFYEHLKQPYSYIHPFALVKSVSMVE